MERNAPRSAERIRTLPWVSDGVDGAERDSAEKLVETARWWPDTFNALLEKPWVYDNITRDEATVIEHAYWITRAYQDESTKLRVSAAVVSLLDMPFLKNVAFADAPAVRALGGVVRDDLETFLDIMAHPKVKDGITDQEAKVIPVTLDVVQYKPESLPMLLDGLDGSGGVYLEERTTRLPLTGEALLAVIRLRDQVTPSMDYLEHSARFVEEFMGEPLPTSYIALYYDDAVSPGAGGHNHGIHLTMLPEHDDEDHEYWLRTPQTIAHELAHYYWTNRTIGPNWFDEGACESISFLSEWHRDGTPLETHLRSRHCTDAKTLAESALLESKSCDYDLGARFFMDLYTALGEDTFRPALRTLYLKSLQDDPADGCEGAKLNICHLEAAFKGGASDEVEAKVDEIIDRWYGPRP